MTKVIRRELSQTLVNQPMCVWSLRCFNAPFSLNVLSPMPTCSLSHLSFTIIFSFHKCYFFHVKDKIQKSLLLYNQLRESIDYRIFKISRLSPWIHCSEIFHLYHLTRCSCQVHQKPIHTYILECMWVYIYVGIQKNIQQLINISKGARISKKSLWG